MEPLPTLDEDMFQEILGTSKTIYRSQIKLPPCTCVIYLQPDLQKKNFQQQVNWADYPVEHKDRMEKIVKKHWDRFDLENLKKTVRGFVCKIHAGNCKPVC